MLGFTPFTPTYSKIIILKAIVAGLSEDAAKQVLDFARFLFVQTHQSADASV